MYQFRTHHSNPKACGSDLRDINCLQFKEARAVDSTLYTFRATAFKLSVVGVMLSMNYLRHLVGARPVCFRNHLEK